MIEADIANFTVEIDKFITGSQKMMEAFATEFLQELNTEVIMATPYITGYLRGSWYASINSVGYEPGDYDPGGGMTVAKCNAVAAEFKAGEGDTYYLCNGAVYAARVEYGFVGQDSLGRYYNQRPRSFVRGTMDRIDEIAARVSSRIDESQFL